VALRVDSIEELPPALRRQAEAALGLASVAKPPPADRSPSSTTGPDVAEAAWQATVIRIGREAGWWAYHTHDSRRSERGFPDLVLVRERVIFAELKRRGAQLRKEQALVIGLLRGAGAEVYVWWPADEADVRRILA